MASIVYNTTSGIILARSGSAQQMMWQFEDHTPKDIFKRHKILYLTASGEVVAKPEPVQQQEVEKRPPKDIFHTPNIFMELQDLFLRMQQNNYKYDRHDDIITSEVIKFLQDEASHWGQELKNSSIQLCYAFTLPTHWDYEIREKLIVPLFIQAGLINKNDPADRLIFFSEMEATFRYIQLKRDPFVDLKIDYNKHYVFCTLDFDPGVRMDLGLISAQYPFFQAPDGNYIPQLFKASQLTVPFELKKREWIQECAQKRCTSKLSTDFIDTLGSESSVYEYLNEEERKRDTSYHRNYMVILSLIFVL